MNLLYHFTWSHYYCCLLVCLNLLATVISSPNSAIPKLPISLTLSSKRYYLPRHAADSAEVEAELIRARTAGVIPKSDASIRRSFEKIRPITTQLPPTTTQPPQPQVERQEREILGKNDLLDLYKRLGQILGVDEDRSASSSRPRQQLLRAPVQNILRLPPIPTNAVEERSIETLNNRPIPNRVHIGEGYRDRSSIHSRIQYLEQARNQRNPNLDIVLDPAGYKQVERAYNLPSSQQVLSEAFEASSEQDTSLKGSQIPKLEGIVVSQGYANFPPPSNNPRYQQQLAQTLQQNPQIQQQVLQTQIRPASASLELSPEKLLSLLRQSRINRYAARSFPDQYSKRGGVLSAASLPLATIGRARSGRALPRSRLRNNEGQDIRTVSAPSLRPALPEIPTNIKPLDDNVFSRLILPRQKSGNLIRAPQQSERLAPSTTTSTTTTTTTTPKPTTTTTTTTTTTQPPTTTTTETTTTRRHRKRKLAPISTTPATVEFSIEELKQLLLATSGKGVDQSELYKAAYFPYQIAASLVPPPIAAPPLPPVYGPPGYEDYLYDLPPPPPLRKRRPSPYKSYVKSPKGGLAETDSAEYGSLSKQLSELSAILTPAPPHYDEYYQDYSFYPISPKKYNKQKDLEDEQSRPPDPFVTADSKRADEIAGNLLSRLGLKEQNRRNTPSSLGPVNTSNSITPGKVLNTLQQFLENIFAPRKEVGPQPKDIPQPAPFSDNFFGFKKS